tara:strand:- start:45 stop:1334 length:1290 start_codon:yes stop_codon:yes gene_type:complete
LAFCGKCGSFIHVTHKFCGKCGYNLSKQLGKKTNNKKLPRNNYHKRPSLNIVQLEQKIHNLTNIERQKRNLSQLSYDTHIQDISRLHSEDMSVRNYFEHTNPDGQEPFDRAASANFYFEKQTSDPNFMRNRFGKLLSLKPYSSQYAYGENLYQTNLAKSIVTINNIPTDYDWQNEDQLAEQIVDGWMKSKDHYENIVKPEWQREGIGVYIANDDKVFATQNFHYCIFNQSSPQPSQPPKINPTKKNYKNKRKRRNTSSNSNTSTGTTIGVPVTVLSYMGKQSGKYIEKQFFTATKSAHVCSPWISKQYVEKMVLMASKGVDIKIITQDVQYNTDTTDLIRNHAFDSLFQSQLARAKRHFHYRIIPKSAAGFIHVKQYIVDGNYAVSGSANFSKSGLWRNQESITIYEGMSNAQVVEEQFDRLWNSTKTS